MLTNEDKKNILKSHLNIIEWLSDKEYQVRAWIKGEAADFDETVCLFFDENDPILKNYKDFEITVPQYFLLKNLSEKFRIFVYENDSPKEFIDTPEWTRITKMAKEVLRAFNYKKE